MGQLPNAKVTPSKLFSKTGLDFCGPVYVRQSLNRQSSKVKTCIAVSVCMTIKAVHLELVSDLRTKASLAAYNDSHAEEIYVKKSIVTMVLILWELQKHSTKCTSLFYKITPILNMSTYQIPYNGIS